MGQYSNRNKYGGTKMKKVLLSVLLIASIITFTSCSKDDEPKFGYPMESLYGTWEGTGINVNGNWIDLTSFLWYEYRFTIKFNSDGSYYGSGYFGNGGGTYKAEGNVVSTYIDGEEYAKYTIKSLSNNKAELTMSMNGSSETVELRVQKQ